MKIAIVGKSRSGKTTLTDYASETYGFVVLNFGDALKEHAATLFPNQYHKEGKPRQLLQVFGQKMREIDQMVWIRQVERQLHEIGDVPVIVGDCRQQNEYAWLREQGFTFIRVEANKDKRIHRMLKQGDRFRSFELEHETELHVDRFIVDYVIENNGELDDLYRQLDEILKKEGE